MKNALQSLLSLLLFYTASNIWSQTSVIQGIVSCNETTISNAIVKINSQEVLSDSNGAFEVKNLMKGKYTLSVSKEGYLSQTTALNLGEAEVKKIEMMMQSKFLELNKVKLISSIGEDVNLVSKVDLKLRPLSSSQDVLRLVPGLFIAQHAGGGKAEQIFLRGFDVDHGTDFAIYVDGMPVNMTSHAHGQGYADLHFLIPETVGNLEVNKGPHSTEYGDLATAGSGEFKTLTSLSDNLVKVEYGMFGTKRILGMVDLLGTKKLFSNNKENLYVAGSYKYTNAYFQEKQYFNRANLFTKYTGILNNGNLLSFSLSSFQSSWDASGQIPDRSVLDGSITRFGSIDPTEGGKTGRSNVNVQYQSKIGKAIFTNQVFYNRYDFKLYSNFTFFLRDSVNGDQISQVDKRNILGYNAKLKFNKRILNKNVITTLGTGVRYDNAELQLNNTIQREQLSRKVYGKLNQTNAWFYADERILLSPKLELNLGSRLDVYNFSYEDYLVDSASGTEVKAIVNPKINLFYNYSSKVRLFAKSGFGFHSNDARAVVVGNLENTLARAFGNEIGSNFKLTKKVLANVVVWSLDLESELIYVGDEGIVEASGATRRYGIDLGLRYQIMNYWYVDLDVNYNKGRLLEEPQNANRIPLAPSLTSIGGISYKNPKGLSGSLRYRYMADRPANEDYSLTATGYFLSDLVLNYSYKKYQFGVTIENMLNTQWNEAQFATESRLRNETKPVEEIHFTPGTPFALRASVSYLF